MPHNPPVPGNYWPPSVARIETVEAFAQAFGTRGYVACSDGAWDPGLEKIALYAKSGTPTHAAKQAGEGVWTSKLGMWETVEHSLDALTGNGLNEYGDVVQYFSRRLTVKSGE